MTSDKDINYQEMQKTDFKLVSPDDAPAAALIPVETESPVETEHLAVAEAQSNAKPTVECPSPPPPAPEVSSYASYFAPSAESPVLPGLPIDFREDNFWERRGRQIFNAFYFGLAFFACVIIGATSEFLYYPAQVLIWLLAAMTLLAIFYSLFHKKVIGRSYVFSLRTQRALRRTALTVPALLMLLAGSNALGHFMDYSWHRTVAADPSAGTPAGHAALINKALAVSPLSTVLAEHLYDDAVSEGLVNEELMLAERMIMFNPTNSRWKIRRMAALHKIPERTVDYLTLRKEYEMTFATDGFLWNTLADIAVADGDWPTALQMANEHIRLHPNEEVALQQRGDIEKSLGMTEEAENDFAAARSASSGH